ncbi:MAG: DUF4296 domain-containing protein [Sphingobacteriales bacterium]|jgi:3-phenylpropionate/cinnamic acid dioxygenase small subunit|nr:DUF4296 domain-containing protein [Sphingobacteriales bacterium]
MRFGAILVFIIVLNSCTPQEEGRPAGILSPDSMAVLMHEIHMAEAGIQSTALEPVEIKKAVAGARYAEVLSRHGLDVVDLQVNFEYYRNRPEEFREIYADVISRMESETARAVNRPVVP